MSKSYEYSEGRGNPYDDKPVVIVVNEEDMRLQKACLKNYPLLFFSIPWAVAGAGIGVLAKRVSPTVNWPLGFGFLGLVTSRIYARAACFNEVMSARNSDWSTIRNKKFIITTDSRLGKFSNATTSELNVDEASAKDVFTQSADTSTTVQFDEYKPMDSYEGYSSFNDSSNTSSIEELDLTETPQPPKRTVSYDELRAKNRAQYAKAAEANKNAPAESWKHPPRTSAPEPPARKVNEYGDEME